MRKAPGEVIKTWKQSSHDGHTTSTLLMIRVRFVDPSNGQTTVKDFVVGEWAWMTLTANLTFPQDAVTLPSLETAEKQDGFFQRLTHRREQRRRAELFRYHHPAIGTQVTLVYQDAAWPMFRRWRIEEDWAAHDWNLAPFFRGLQSTWHGWAAAWSKRTVARLPSPEGVIVQRPARRRP